MKLTFLGTGTSQGVPVIGCRCEVCQSADERDQRLRTSAMVECEDCRIIIDAGPDFRQQMLRTGARAIDAILLTHEHKDHTGGLDDVRAFNFVDFPIIRVVDIFANTQTAAAIKKDYDYAFADNKYIGAPEMRLHTIDTTAPFEVKGHEIIPINGRHSERFFVTGYRIGPLAYMTDFKELLDGEATVGFGTITIYYFTFTGKNGGDTGGIILGIVFQICILNDNGVTGRIADPGTNGCAFALIFLLDIANGVRCFSSIDPFPDQGVGFIF